MSCRCGEPATKVCHLCKSPLCDFHAGTKPVNTVLASGLTRIRLEPICFPDCTSLFGERDEDAPRPVAQA